MSGFNVGDLVEAVKGRSVICGYLNSDRDIVTENVTHTPSFLVNNGWTLRTVERATPPLPAEPGHYQDKEGRHWLHQVHDGSAYGTPERITDQWIDPWGHAHKHPELHAPFTRLEPVADTAKKVLAVVRARAITRNDDNMTIRYLVLENIAAEFEVQS